MEKQGRKAREHTITQWVPRTGEGKPGPAPGGDTGSLYPCCAVVHKVAIDKNAAGHSPVDWFEKQQISKNKNKFETLK